MFGRPHNLRQRAALYILAPICVLLISVELIGFSSIKSMLLQQMKETGLSHLQRTAHHIESRLRQPKNIMAKLAEADKEDVRTFLTSTIQSLDGTIELHQMNIPSSLSELTSSGNLPAKVFYDPVFKDGTVLLHAEVQGDNKKAVYSAALSISLYDLIGYIPHSPSWNTMQTFLLDAEGNILSPGEPPDTSGKVKNHANDLISKENLAKLQQLIQESPTGFLPADNSNYPETIYDYHTLKEAPYTMVVSIDGAFVFKPLHTFRMVYLLSSITITAIILFLLNLMANRIIRNTQKLSNAANRLASGHFDKPLQTDRDDEIGLLVQSFNSMSEQLQKGVQVQKALVLAGEIQQSLLPQSEFSDHHFEAFGFSLPCDETGGDLFDILPSSKGPLYLIVGDVVGHGVGAALLMATTRALLRSEIEHASNLASCVNRVNKLLCRDTAHSGNFSTLFLLSLERENRTLHWVRAGHEPAMLYNLEQDTFTELKGKGIALGVDPTIDYLKNSLILPEGEHLVLIGSDGLTDLEDLSGQRFGKKRIKQLLKQHASRSAKEILTILNKEINTFADNKRSDDDITAVIAKIR